MRDIFNGVGFVFGMTVFCICAALVVIFMGMAIFYFLDYIRQGSEAAALFIGVAIFFGVMFGSFKLAINCLKNS